MIRLQTQRLILRDWQDTDLDPFAEMNADPDVMAYFPSLLARPESDALVQRMNAHHQTYGFGL